MHLPDSVRNLVATPSFYGLIMWVSGFMLYYFGPIPWNRPTASFWIVFLTGAASYLFSLLFSYFVLNKPAHTPPYWWIPRQRSGSGYYMALFLHVVGFIGVAIYVSDFGRSMGSIGYFREAFVYQSYLIRLEAEATTSYGFQLSYFGWMGIGISILLRSEIRSRRMVLNILCIAQFAANLVFIDRTRPTWIIFVSVLLLVMTSRTLTLRKLLVLATTIPLFFVAMFIVIGSWIGKTDFNEAFKSEDKISILEGPIYYASCGFAYLNWASDHAEQTSEPAQRTLYPLYRIWEIFDKSKKPPSQINDFVNVPLPTNVGTFMEPFIRDGGLLFAIVGALIHSFGLDVMAAILRRQGSSWGFFLIANLCFVNFIGFFTPKLNSFPIWLFAGIWFFAAVAIILDPRHVGPQNSRVG